MGHRNKRMGAFVSKHRKPKGDTEPTETDKAEIADLISKTNEPKEEPKGFLASILKGKEIAQANVTYE